MPNRFISMLDALIRFHCLYEPERVHGSSKLRLRFRFIVDWNGDHQSWFYALRKTYARHTSNPWHIVSTCASSISRCRLNVDWEPPHERVDYPVCVCAHAKFFFRPLKMSSEFIIYVQNCIRKIYNATAAACNLRSFYANIYTEIPGWSVECGGNIPYGHFDSLLN